MFHSTRSPRGFAFGIVLVAFGASPLFAASTNVPVPLGEAPITIVGTPIPDRGENTKKQGFKACYGDFGRVSSTPMLSFDLGDALPDHAVVRLVKGAGVFVMPGGSYLCVKEGQQIPAKFLKTKGKYEFRTFQNFKGEPKLTLADPVAISAGAVSRFKEVELDFSRNPASVEVEIPKMEPISLKNAGLKNCGYEKWAIPVAEVTVAETSTYVLRYSGVGVIQGPDGACLKRVSSFKSREFKKGKYRFWRTGSTPEKLSRDVLRITVRDAERPVAWPKANVVDFTKKKMKHQDIPFEYPAPAMNVLGHGCDGIGTDPVALIKVKKKGASYGESWGPGGKPIVVGPLESSAKAMIRCTQNTGKKAKGTYAIFRATKPELKGAPAIFSVGPDPKSLLELTAEVADDMPLKNREVGRYYAHYMNRTGFMYYGLSQYPQDIETPVDVLFAKAPKEILVFAKSTKGGLTVGEPLLLKSFGEEKSTVHRLDGSLITVRNSALGTAVPDEVTFPTKSEKITAPKDLKEGLRLAGPMQLALIAKLDKAYDKYRSCYTRYRSKKDPTFGENFDLVNTRTGEKVSDKWHVRAEKKCKWKKHAKKEKSTVKSIVKARNKEKAAARKAMKKLSK